MPRSRCFCRNSKKTFRLYQFRPQVHCSTYTPADHKDRASKLRPNVHKEVTMHESNRSLLSRSQFMQESSKHDKGASNQNRKQTMIKNEGREIGDNIFRECRHSGKTGNFEKGTQMVWFYLVFLFCLQSLYLMFE